MTSTNTGYVYGSWTTDGTINGSALTPSGSLTSSAIQNNVASPSEILGNIVEVILAYGASTVTSTTISILGETAAGYQSTTDAPFQFTYPPSPAASTAYTTTFFVGGTEYSSFKIGLLAGANTNNITATVKYRTVGLLSG